ncbi:hypothetical protein [Microbacterium sp. MPKO10]|uniref:hypothetical protein n=1 Tax=Microbacterium sp. MPKO10 TaxID=2989818 RepID=UPI0022366D2C|nr:hypothetical protein [Microbacterium sp. MPKO10]MCW4458703.1 hypothetical protein [Microbacterium sp. MPKO10]
MDAKTGTDLPTAPLKSDLSTADPENAREAGNILYSANVFDSEIGSHPGISVYPTKTRLPAHAPIPETTASRDHPRSGHTQSGHTHGNATHSLALAFAAWHFIIAFVRHATALGRNTTGKVPFGREPRGLALIFEPVPLPKSALSPGSVTLSTARLPRPGPLVRCASDTVNRI